MEFTFHILFGLFGFVRFCYATCDDCLVTRLPDFENHLIPDYQLWSRRTPTQSVCFRLCLVDSICVSFHYNTVSKLCIGYRTGFTSPLLTQTTNDTGNNLFLTCEATNRYGAPCSNVSDCHDENNTCINGACQCMSAFKYSTVTWSCFQYYLGCYEDRSDRMLPHAIIVSDQMTTQFCVSHCRDEGYSLASTQYYTECYCGDVIPSGYSKYNESRCNTACRGDNTEICGGVWAASVYTTQQ